MANIKFTALTQTFSAGVDDIIPMVTTGDGLNKRITINTLAQVMSGYYNFTSTTQNITLNYLPLSGNISPMTGYIILNGDPVIPFHAATKQYVDAFKLGSVPLSGNTTMTGPLTAPSMTVTDSLSTPRIAGPLTITNTLTAQTVTVTSSISASNYLGLQQPAAMVAFVGTGANGPCVINKKYGNIASVTKNGTGNYTVNFTTPFPDNNYIIMATCNNVTGVGNGYVTPMSTDTLAGSVRFQTYSGATLSISNPNIVYIIIYY